MVGESNQNVFLIQIEALSFAEFEISVFEISRFDCIDKSVDWATKTVVLFCSVPSCSDTLLALRPVWINTHEHTVNSRYLEVVGTIFYKFKLPEVQINLHFG